MSDLRLICSGLVGFVPAKDSAGQGSMFVVLPRVRKGLIASDRPRSLAAHHALLRVETKFLPNLAVSSRKPDWLIRKPDSGLEEYLFILNDEQLSIVTGNPMLEPFGISRGIAGQDDPQPNPTLDLDPYLKAKSDFKWIPSFDRIFPGKAGVDGDVIGGNGLNLLNVRLQTFEGTWSTLRLAGGEGALEKAPDKIDTFRFEAASPFVQTIADQVIMRLKFHAANLVLSSHKLEDRTRLLPDLVLTPQAGIVEVRLQNIEFEGLLTPDSSSNANSDAEDFINFHELMKVRPVAVARIPPVIVHGGGAGQRICPTAAFADETLP